VSPKSFSALERIETNSLLINFISSDAFRGRWHCNDVNGQCKGNLTLSAEVDNMMASVKHKINSQGMTRTHSSAMSREHAERILTWSKKQCPELASASQYVLRTMQGLPCEGPNMEVRTSVTRHLEQLAFSAAVWILWTRYVHT